MSVINEIADLKQEMTAWRRALHAAPELGFQETETAKFVESKLASFGVDEIHRLAGTGVVAVLHGKNGAAQSPEQAVMLRADMDALPIIEDTGVPYASKNAGVLHGCGHDGHMAMLLGAAKHLARTRDFDGTVYFVFQPAEEIGEGADKMIAEDIFKRFPCKAIYGMHNFPGLPLGVMATVKGDMLSAAQDFTITLSGIGGHAARPENTTDVIAAACKTTMMLKTESLKLIPPGEPAVLSVCAYHTSGIANNVLPESVEISGTVRSFDPNVQKKLTDLISTTANAVGARFGATVDIQFTHTFPKLENHAAETETALAAARDTLGMQYVMPQIPRTLGTEDFASFLQKKPGNFMALGTGPQDGTSVPDLHSPKYDFNDAALPVGAAYWVNLVRRALTPALPPAVPPSSPAAPSL